MINKLFLVLVIHFFVYARDINLNDLVQKATQKNKHLFVFLHRTDCGYCESLKEIKVLRRGRVRRAKLYYLRNLAGKKARIPELRRK